MNSVRIVCKCLSIMKTTFFSFTFFLITGSFLLSAESFAQQTQQTGQATSQGSGQTTTDGQQGSLLPEINPRDIEIRSQYQARFPGVTRQPILGFKPRPRIYQIDPNRMPYLESEDEQIVNLPIGILSRPAAPTDTPYRLPELGFTTVELGHGSEGSPVGSVWFQTPLGFNPERSAIKIDSTAFPWISGTLRLRSLAPYDSNADGDHLTGEAALRVSHPLGMNSHLQVGLEGLFSDRSLFALPGFSDPLNPDAPVGDPRTSFSGVSLNTTLNHIEDNYRGWKTALQTSVFNHSMKVDDPMLRSGADQVDVEISYSRQWPGSQIMDLVSAQVDLGFRQVSQNPGHSNTGQANLGQTDVIDPQETAWIRAKADLHRLIRYETDLRFSGSLVLMNIHDGVTILPELSAVVSHPLHRFVTVNGGVRSSVSAFDLKQSLARNPWIRSDLEFKHRVDAELFSELSVQLLTQTSFRIGGRLEGIHNHEQYKRDLPDPENPDLQGYFTLDYNRVGFASFYSTLTQPLFKDQFTGSIEVEYRTQDFVNDRSIPYEEEFAVTGALSASLFDAGHLSLSARHIGERKTDAGLVLPAFVHLSLKGRVELGERFELWLRADNLLNEEIQIWDGVIERPFELFSGISYSF